MTLITSVEVKDIRFPTSRNLDGSDAMNKSPDYSAAYVILETDHPGGLEGHGLTFTIGRGNEICVAAIRALEPLILGKSLESFTSDMRGFWQMITGDSQLRWLGPEKGVIHLATGAVVNAVWDLYAKVEGKPLWRLISDMTPEQIVGLVDFTYITDVLTPQEALGILQKQEDTKQKRVEDLMASGYPAYTTSAGWLGYSDEKMVRLAKEAVAEGFDHIKLKVGGDIEDDKRRMSLIRSVFDDDVVLMIDANQRWEVGEAIKNMKELGKYEPLWIEEPTSPDDVLGHAKIAQAVTPVKVATGEHCQNRVLFKQFLEAGGMGVCQIDSCRVGGVNELLAIMLMAAKFEIPVCPHAGGVGLCEHVQHLSMIDYVAISGKLEGRVIEYVDHLHEHFVDPVVIKKGCYMPPTKPGYSIQMLENSLKEYSYPNGSAWNKEISLKYL